MRRGSLVCAWPFDTAHRDTAPCSAAWSSVPLLTAPAYRQYPSTLEYLQDHVHISSAYLLQCRSSVLPVLISSFQQSPKVGSIQSFSINTCVNKVRAYPPKSVWKNFAELI